MMNIRDIYKSSFNKIPNNYKPIEESTINNQLKKKRNYNGNLVFICAVFVLFIITTISFAFFRAHYPNSAAVPVVNTNKPILLSEPASDPTATISTPEPTTTLPRTTPTSVAMDIRPTPTSEPTGLTPLKLRESLPVLKVLYKDKIIEAKRGSFSWTVDNNDGTMTDIDASSMIPPELVKDSTPLTVSPESSLSLSFSDNPINISISVLQDNKPIKQSMIDNKIVTPELRGFVIYEVSGAWEQGTVSYAFLVKVE